jgi:hypothetical protein
VWGLVSDMKGRKLGFLATALFTFFFGLLRHVHTLNMEKIPCNVRDEDMILLIDGLLASLHLESLDTKFALGNVMSSPSPTKKMLDSCFLIIYDALMLMLGLWVLNCSAWSPTYWFLLLARTLVGFGLGGSSVRLQSKYLEWYTLSIPNFLKQFKDFLPSFYRTSSVNLVSRTRLFILFFCE